MKENRFIELLNLYIDRQISAAETAELEAELQNSPKRQAVYRQYCQIHAATKQVYETFRASEVGSNSRNPVQPGVIELFENRRRRTQWAYYLGGVAAAACLAVVFLRSNATPQPAAQATVASKIGSPAAVVAAPVATIRSVEFAPAPVALGDAALARTPDYSALLAALREQDEERAFSNERLYIGRVQPLFDDTLFQPMRAISGQDQRVFRSQQAAPAAQTEFSAFQFQR